MNMEGGEVQNDGPQEIIHSERTVEELETMLNVATTEINRLKQKKINSFLTEEEKERLKKLKKEERQKKKRLAKLKKK